VTRSPGRQRSLSLRRRLTLAFALGALAVSVLFASATYALTRNVLLAQRENTILRQAYLDANVLRNELTTAGTSPTEALALLEPQGATAVLIHRDGQWYSSSLEVDSGAVPAELQAAAVAGSIATTPARVLGVPSLVVGVPLTSAGAEVYEIRPLSEVQETLRTLATVLAAGAAAAVLLSAALGARAGRRVLQPLAPLADTAGAIASGTLSRRLPDTSDPDLAAIVGSFNSMVDALQQRIERDSRFAADVSHELRSPLTTLVGSVDLLATRAHELSPTGREALRLVSEEIERMRRLLEDLIDLSRSDPAALAEADLRDVRLAELVRHVLRERRVEPAALQLGDGEQLVHGDPRALARVVGNLVDNAERHGGGTVAVSIQPDDNWVLLTVEDAGPGIPPGERERVFERFATLPGARGSGSSSGLGLSLVRETVDAHGGAVWCTARPGGGTRFHVRLPLARG
jgi:signal transduction histidine kinase